MGHKARIHPTGQAPTECLRRTVQQDRALRMAVPISLGRSGPCTTRRHAVDVVLQSRAPKYGSGRIYPKTAARHGRVAFLLLAIAINGGITKLRGALPDPRSHRICQVTFRVPAFMEFA